MSEKEILQFYRNLSRKDLQTLCKKCSLPANRSRSEMAESLLFFLQGGIGGSISYFQDTSRSIFISQRGKSSINHKQPPIGFYGRVENIHKLPYRRMNLTSSSKESASPMRSSTKVPTFQFFVSSEEGINLCIDLTSGPSEWIKKYKNQIHSCDNDRNNKSTSLCQGLGCTGECDSQMKSSFFWNMDPGQTVDEHVQAEHSPSLSVDKYSNVGTGETDGGNKSPMASPIKPHTLAVNVSDCLREGRKILSLIPDSDLHEQMVSNSESCTKNGGSATLDSGTTDTKTEKTACDFVVNSVSDGSVSLVALGPQTSKQDDEVCEISTLNYSCNLQNTSVPFPGCLTNLSRERQSSECGYYHKDDKNCEFLDLFDANCNPGTEPDEFTNSSENGPLRNYFATCCEEQQEWRHVLKERKNSICSQVVDSLDETCLKLNNLEPNEKFDKKRPHINLEGENGRSVRDAKILRSSEQAAGEILSRRSMSDF